MFIAVYKNETSKIQKKRADLKMAKIIQLFDKVKMEDGKNGEDCPCGDDICAFCEEPLDFTKNIFTDGSCYYHEECANDLNQPIPYWDKDSSKNPE